MSNVTRMIARVVMLRAKSKIMPEISEKYRAMLGTGTCKAIYIINDTGRKIHIDERDVYLSFVDHSKAFAMVKHKEQMQILIELDIDKWHRYIDFSSIRNVY